jgi:hypothetical protein
LAFNNFVLFDRVHVPIIRKRAAMVEEDLLSVREVCQRKDKRGVDLISDALPFGRLWYGEPNAASNAFDYAKFFSRSHDAVIRVYDGLGNVIETHEHRWRVQRVVKFLYCRTGRLFLGNFSSRLKWLWKPFEITATATEWLKNASALPD